MKIRAVHFDYFDNDNYKRLADVWEYSAKKYNPDADVKLITVDFKKVGNDIKDSWVYNDHKLSIWRDEIIASDDDIVVMDADMIVLGDISAPFKKDFDICYTARTRSRYPLNGGVIFAHPTEGAKKFVKEWYALDKEMLSGHGFHQRYRVKYGGMNQASFGAMIEAHKQKCKLETVTCSEYNLCDEEWKYFDDNVKILHVKGALRCAVLGNVIPKNKKYADRIDIPKRVWQTLEAELKEGKK